jgi:hypothetical protein
VLPVQIFLWADSPERAFVERTSAAIMVLLGFLLVMNARPSGCAAASSGAGNASRTPDGVRRALRQAQ